MAEADAGRVPSRVFAHAVGGLVHHSDLAHIQRAQGHMCVLLPGLRMPYGLGLLKACSRGLLLMAFLRPCPSGAAFIVLGLTPAHRRALGCCS